MAGELVVSAVSRTASSSRAALVISEPTNPGDVFTLDLGRRGVSDLCWDPVTKGYLIAAAKSNGPKRDKDRNYPPNSLDNALFWWSGRKGEKPLLFAKTHDMKV